MKKKITVIITILILAFIISHISPSIAIRTRLITLFNGSAIELVFSDIHEINQKDTSAEKKFFIIKEDVKHNSLANDYVWGVTKKGFLYFAYPIGKG
ncbi:hypothetical protein [Peptostreptococcus porci]|uniref:hypothetical protein n=1 Tax=Peptostreptococcus porci TaxID=2652282 RepID=UPI0023F4DDB3|nr:hypothetical protein [Peptostreptococcus porci]MDD7182201.1 hypothetical protein [Peptostreptococcus porci]MDY2795263.1 hypothetical protein [Peptostreptococcus porci]MDY4128352.1 hypothetical protein [Peptostreptococcus porci]MDY5435259.1 hypothetical protein [Peptostreptococcus porci]MDY5480726.1 hypothetical protein [Peptostreptococcus porci]